MQVPAENAGIFLFPTLRAFRLGRSWNGFVDKRWGNCSIKENHFVIIKTQIMSKFKMLVGGQIIEVFHVNTNTGQISGWNLESPNLRIKTYKPKSFKKSWNQNLTDIGVVSIVLLDDRGERLPTDQLDKLRWSIELMVKD